MPTPVKWAETHTALFVAGTNLGLKHCPKKRVGLILAFDRDFKELLVTWNGETAHVPEANVSLWIEADPVAKLVTEQPAPPKGKVTAQVATPQDHVFSGPGGGKTRS